jgi:hypothetical protein
MRDDRVRTDRHDIYMKPCKKMKISAARVKNEILRCRAALMSISPSFMEYEFSIEIWCKCMYYMSMHMGYSVEFIEGKKIWGM